MSGNIFDELFNSIILPILVLLVFAWIPSCIVIWLINRHFHKIEKELDRWIWLKKAEIKDGIVWENKVIVEYQPPKWLNPTEVWFLYDWSVWKPDIICMIYKWLSMWLVSLQYEWWKIIVKKLLDIYSWAPRYEQVFWDIVFKKWNIVKFPNERIYWELWVVKQTLQKYCQENKRIKKSSVYFSLEDLFKGSNKISYIPFWRLIWRFVWWFMIIIWFVVPIFSTSEILLSLSIVFPVVWLFVVMCFGISLSETGNKGVLKFTENWYKVVAQIYWYKQFLESCEEKQLQKFMNQDPLYFDKTLPYAIALGLENIISSKIPDNIVLDDAVEGAFLLEKVL